MRQVEHEEAGLLLDTADHHHRLAEIGLRMARRVRQRAARRLPGHDASASKCIVA
jgi:hypothetical protein